MVAHAERGTGISVDNFPFSVLPKEVHKPAFQFQRQAVLMRRIPGNLVAQERLIAPLFEETNLTEQESLFLLLSESSNLSKLVDWYILGVETDVRTRKLEESASEVIRKTTRANRPISPHVEPVIHFMLDTIQALDTINPLDVVPSGSPTFADLARVAESGDLSSPANQEVYERIPRLFASTGIPEQAGFVGFLLYLSDSDTSAIVQRDFMFPNQEISNETLAMLANAGILLRAHLDSALDTVMETAYGNTSGEFPAPSESSYFPVALGIHSLVSTQVATMMPTSYEALLESNFIPGLEESAAAILKFAHRKSFYENHPNLLYLTDREGVHPYALLKNNYDARRSLDWLNELVPHYQMPEDAKEHWNEFSLEVARITSFLRSKVIHVEGDERIKAIYVGSSNPYGIDIIVQSPDDRVFAVQIGSNQPGLVKTFGIPGCYDNQAREFVGNVMVKVLTAIRNEGYLDQPIPDKSEKSEVKELREQFEEQFRKKVDRLHTNPQNGTAVPAELVPSVHDSGSSQPEGGLKRRFTIVTPEEIIEKSDLTETEIAVIRREIERVEFSAPGTYPMKKLGGYKEDVRRIKVKRIVTSPDGHKSRVDVRIAVEFEGTHGTVVKIANRQGVFKEVRELFH